MAKLTQQVSYTLSEIREIIRTHASNMTDNPQGGNTIQFSNDVPMKMKPESDFLAPEILKGQTPFCTVTFQSKEKN